jgi:hypothetical protein
MTRQRITNAIGCLGLAALVAWVLLGGLVVVLGGGR